MKIHRKVALAGEIYWLHESSMEGYLNISPLHHYDEEGKRTCDELAESYALVTPRGTIYRMGKMIGWMTDLRMVE